MLYLQLRPDDDGEEREDDADHEAHVDVKDDNAHERHNPDSLQHHQQRDKTTRNVNTNEHDVYILWRLDKSTYEHVAICVAYLNIGKALS